MINYPFSLKDNVNKNINNKNKGMFLEDVINNTNEYYRLNNIALIYKNLHLFKLSNYLQIKNILKKPFLRKNQLLIIMEFIKENILILKQKNVLPQLHFH